MSYDLFLQIGHFHFIADVLVCMIPIVIKKLLASKQLVWVQCLERTGVVILYLYS